MFASPFAPTRRLASSYQQLDIETVVSTADPHKLIALLFDGALSQIAMARAALASGDVPARGQAIGRALRIVGEGLRASLDLSSGAKLGQDLDALYDYVTRRLLHANMKADDAALQECAKLLGTVREGWMGIASGASAAVPAANAPATNAVPVSGAAAAASAVSTASAASVAAGTVPPASLGGPSMSSPARAFAAAAATAQPHYLSDSLSA